MSKEIIKAIRETAREQYNVSYGWSMIEECFTDQEINSTLVKNNIQTVEEAINYFNSVASLHTERYEEVQAEIF